jgi:4-amino-4-deoxy-L-arabinose transferase-like glycosyltransferase
MNHTIVAFFATLALAELPVWTDGADQHRRRAAVTIGLSLGCAIAVRPLDGAMATLAFGVLLLQRAAAERRPLLFIQTAVAGALRSQGSSSPTGSRLAIHSASDTT